MSCKKCGQAKSPCGCGDTPYTTTTIPADCNPVPNCSEYVYSGCDIYNGPAIVGLCDNCGPVLTVTTRVDGSWLGTLQFDLTGVSSGTGIGAVFTVNIFTGYCTIAVSSGGTGYRVGDVITIQGSALCQAGDGYCDLTFTVTSIDSDINCCQQGPYILPGMGMNEIIQRLTLLAMGVRDMDPAIGGECEHVTTLTTSSIKANSITITFTSSTLVTNNYYVMVSIAGTGAFTKLLPVITAPSTPTQLSYVITTYDNVNVLVSGAAYDIYVISDCPPQKPSVTIRVTTTPS